MAASRPRFLASVILPVIASLALAACGASATQAPSPAPSPSLAPSVATSTQPSVEPSAAASVEPSAATSANPSLALPSFASDKDLEALLPATFQGKTLTRQSVKLASLASSGSAEFQAIVTAIGVDPTSVSVAFAGDYTGALTIQFLAIRFPGADSGRLTAVFLQEAQKTGTVSQVNLGGKDVLKSVDTTSKTTGYFYVKGDIVLGVNAKSDADAAAGLAVLP